ncbi:MAG: flagellin [Rhodospirillales bacterium]
MLANPQRDQPYHWTGFTPPAAPIRRRFSGRVSHRRVQTRTLTLQSNFINSIVDATTTGLGAIVDADIGKASAVVQAQQVRQQLGIQSLSIANQQPSVLLGLFR